MRPRCYGGGMKQVIGVFFTTLFLGLNSQAQYLNMSDYVDELVEIANQVQMSHDVTYQIGGTNVSDSCVAFMDKSLILGDVGKAIFTSMREKKSSFPHLMQGGTLSKYCSKYPQMEDEQKMMIWVMVLTMVAHFESSCNIKAKAKGPNGTAKGYYQLHAGKEQNYDNDLDMCVKNASSSGKLSSKCTLAMLEKQLDRDNGQLFSSKSYWDVLRPNGAAQKADDIQRTLKKSSLCNPLVI